MLKIKTVKEQLREAQRKNERLLAAQKEQQSNIDYLAMMCEVELETEADYNEQIWQGAGLF